MLTKRLYRARPPITLHTSGTIDPGSYIPLQDIPYNASSSLFDDFTLVHNILNDYIHQTGFFFPWHRLFVWHFEQTLIHQCHYTGSAPYWNWTLDSDDLGHSYLLTNSDPNIGFGNFGDEAHQQEVIDGALANFSLSYPYPHLLRREYFPYPWKNLTPPWFTDPTLKVKDVISIDGISETINGFRGDFREFQTHFERMQGPHMGVHLALGGDIGGFCIWGKPFCDSLSYGNPGTSPSEPLFWLHHGFIDKIWHDWQNMRAENKFAFGGGSKREIAPEVWPKYPIGAPPDLTPDFPLPSVGFLPSGLTVKDVLDTTNDILCYTYE
ncbi:hypothetical protein Clacol_009653 [Clathrus columnatus]|uniref:Tyrosinase copper-binding domain-containing protein n=1 Tax=Clathrus columnatus TaxID=1419009 RepID=A0AAV5AL26_9AGAM|nr:hypothetical protein Clacol_009653 [Clathrus columnatus]